MRQDIARIPWLVLLSRQDWWKPQCAVQLSFTASDFSGDFSSSAHGGCSTFGMNFLNCRKTRNHQPVPIFYWYQAKCHKWLQWQYSSLKSYIYIHPVFVPCFFFLDFFSAKPSNANLNHQAYVQKLKEEALAKLPKNPPPPALMMHGTQDWRLVDFSQRGGGWFHHVDRSRGKELWHRWDDVVFFMFFFAVSSCEFQFWIRT